MNNKDYYNRRKKFIEDTVNKYPKIPPINSEYTKTTSDSYNSYNLPNSYYTTPTRICTVVLLSSGIHSLKAVINIYTDHKDADTFGDVMAVHFVDINRKENYSDTINTYDKLLKQKKNILFPNFVTSEIQFPSNIKNKELLIGTQFINYLYNNFDDSILCGTLFEVNFCTNLRQVDNYNIFNILNKLCTIANTYGINIIFRAPMIYEHISDTLRYIFNNAQNEVIYNLLFSNREYIKHAVTHLIVNRGMYALLDKEESYINSKMIDVLKELYKKDENTKFIIDELGRYINTIK